MTKIKKYYCSILIFAIFFIINTIPVFSDLDIYDPETIFKNHDSVMLIIDSSSGAIIDANTAAELFYKYTRNELIQMKISEINTLSEEEIKQEMEVAISEKRNYFEFKHRLKDGSIRDVEVYSSPASDNEGNRILFSIVHDITEKKLTEREVINNKTILIYLLGSLVIILLGVSFFINRVKKNERNNKNKLKSLFDNMQEGFALHEIILNSEGVPIDYRFLNANNAFENITGLKLETIKNKTVKEVLPETEQYWIDTYGEVAINGKSVSFSNYSSELDKHFNVNVYSPSSKHFVTIFTDVTLEKKVQQKIKEERTLLKTTLHSIGDAVISTDIKGNIDIMNAVAEKLTGWINSEAKGQPFQTVFNIINEFTRKPCDNPVDKVLETEEIIELENHTLLIKKNKEEISIEDSAAPIRNEKGKVNGVVVVFRDCTEKKEKQEKIQFLSYHDQLTGLYNRHFFEEELKRLDVDRNLPFTIAMIDVNGLKLTNDAFGHEAGDLLLKSVAKALKSECRTEDVLSRVGGDEFVILLPKTNYYETELIVKRIHKAIDKQKIDNIIVSVSIGWETKENSKQDIKEVFSKAEDYMYRNKITESQSMRNQTIKIIMQTLHETNLQEKVHSERVSQLSRKIGEAMKLDKEVLKELEITGLMHDIGKIAIIEQILNKPGPLTEIEFEEVKRHPEISYHILKSVDIYTRLAEYVLSHHERWDGMGYPRGLSGEEIPLVARIITVADAY